MKVSVDLLFANYFYFSSSIGTLRDHFKEYAAEVTARFLNPESSTVIEIGCNDGVLLRPLADQNIRTVIGVDPATNVVRTIGDSRVRIVNDFFRSRSRAGSSSASARPTWWSSTTCMRIFRTSRA